MMMYVVVNMNDADEVELFKSANKAEAMKMAREHDYINKRDKNRTHTELRIYPNGYEDMDSFDYETLEITEA